MPSAVSPHVSWFDRFAAAAARVTSRAWFFASCLLLVLLWAPSLPLFGSVDTWQLIINTLTTIVTFLLVALLQNAQTRADAAVQHKLNAVAAGLASLMEAYADDPATTPPRGDALDRAIGELVAAVGLERRESS